jgi:hypothetical protein
MLKSDEQVNREAVEDLESLRDGTARYSTLGEDVVAIMLASLGNVLLIVGGLWWLLK